MKVGFESATRHSQASPAYPASVFSEISGRNMERGGGRGFRDRDQAHLDPSSCTVPQPQSSHPLALQLVTEKAFLTLSKAPQSSPPEESPNTGDIGKQQKTTNRKEHRQQGQPRGSWERKMPLGESPTPVNGLGLGF